MKKAIFYIDGGNGEYTGYCTGRTWNGWYTPWFAKSEVNRILESEQFEGVRFEWNTLGELREVFDYGNFIVESRMHDGEKLYRLGDGFCWDTDQILETL